MFWLFVGNLEIFFVVGIGCFEIVEVNNLNIIGLFLMFSFCIIEGWIVLIKLIFLLLSIIVVDWFGCKVGNGFVINCRFWCIVVKESMRFKLFFKLKKFIVLVLFF